ncbi:MAG TPA: Lrp/AsnC family transcriptional regulator [Thermoanaerobaculia bacterium]|nr:Lrp/AsnC family transcriptional regulator [Thermoanaerobaculia bacterium]
MSSLVTAVPISINDPLNQTILEVSEDQIQGFAADPIGEIAAKSGIDADTVIERMRAMLEAGTIRRIRQTLLATNLAQGALIAWKLPFQRLDVAFDFLLENDPFTGHIVIRRAELAAGETDYRLWTTLKVPKGFSLEEHCALLQRLIGAEAHRIMPPLRVFALGVGHMRRKGLEIGARSEHPAEAREAAIVDLDENDWRILMVLKREFSSLEIVRDLWSARAEEAGVDRATFMQVASDLDRRGVIGRFSTFLEHVKPAASGERVTKYNGLFQWAVPKGREIEAGSEIGRFHALTHCYWRDAGPELNDVNIMAVAHGEQKATVLMQKEAIDAHLDACGIPLLYTNTFWGVRSEVRPSEISPVSYRTWKQRFGREEKTTPNPHVIPSPKTALCAAEEGMTPQTLPSS